MQITHYLNNKTGIVERTADSTHSENTAPPDIAGFSPISTHDVNEPCDYCKIQVIQPHIPTFDEVKADDPVNHPAHYTAGGIEVINYMKAKMSPEAFRGLLHGNVIKYISRYSFKSGVEDLQKCAWYLNKLIEEEQTPSS